MFLCPGKRNANDNRKTYFESDKEVSQDNRLMSILRFSSWKDMFPEDDEDLVGHAPSPTFWMKSVARDGSQTSTEE